MEGVTLLTSFSRSLGDLGTKSNVTQQILETMASRPVVLCYSSFTPPTPARNLLFELARAYEDDFTLLDQKVVTDLSEDERAKIEGIVCNGG